MSGRPPVRGAGSGYELAYGELATVARQVDPDLEGYSVTDLARGLVNRLTDRNENTRAALESMTAERDAALERAVAIEDWAGMAGRAERERDAALAAIQRVRDLFDAAELMILADEHLAELVAPPVRCVAVVDVHAALYPSGEAGWGVGEAWARWAAGEQHRREAAADSAEGAGR